MKKSLIALAALAATSSAMAQVSLYGRANVFVDNYSATGATAGTAFDIAGRNRVVDTGSRFGFRVNEDLGGGTRAFVTCETGINVDNGAAGGGSGAPNSAANTFCSREGHIGWGNKNLELRLGRQNVYWTHGDLNQTGANFLGGDVAGAFYAASSGMSLGAASRVDNTILLQLNQGLGANFAGSHVYYATTGENKGIGFTTNTPAATQGANQAIGTTGPNLGNATATNANGSVAQNATANTMGFKLNFNQGPIGAMADWAKVSDSANLTTAASNVDRTSWKIAGGYRHQKAGMISATYFTHETAFSNPTTNAAAPVLFSGLSTLNLAAGSSVATGSAVAGGRKQSGWALNLVHDLGGGLFGYAQYAKMNDATNSAGASVAQTGASGMLVGVRKNLSARTGVYAAYMKIDNNANNAVNFTGGAYAPGVSQAGADPKVMHVGMMHNF